MEITINNVVLVFSATNEEPPYGQYIVQLILVNILTICLGTYLRYSCNTLLVIQGKHLKMRPYAMTYCNGYATIMREVGEGLAFPY